MKRGRNISILQVAQRLPPQYCSWKGAGGKRTEKEWESQESRRTHKKREREGGSCEMHSKRAEGQESTMEEANTKMRQQLRKLSRCWEKESTSQNQSFWLWLSQWWDKEIQSHLTRRSKEGHVQKCWILEQLKRSRENMQAEREKLQAESELKVERMAIIKVIYLLLQ